MCAAGVRAEEYDTKIDRNNGAQNVKQIEKEPQATTAVKVQQSQMSQD